MFQVWFQNRRAKWRKKENTKKGPGRPAHNAHPQTCSGDPIDPEELKRKESERMERKKRKQEERTRMRKSSSDRGRSGDEFSMSENSRDEPEIDVVGEDGSEDSSSPLKPVLQSPFSIASLLEAPKVPRGRRPNSKYPRVQASKSMNPLALGMFPLFPITQPVGFQVERPPSPSTPSPPPSPDPARTFTSPSASRDPLTSRASMSSPGHDDFRKDHDHSDQEDSAGPDMTSASESHRSSYTTTMEPSQALSGSPSGSPVPSDTEDDAHLRYIEISPLAQQRALHRVDDAKTDWLAKAELLQIKSERLATNCPSPH